MPISFDQAANSPRNTIYKATVVMTVVTVEEDITIVVNDHNIVVYPPKYLGANVDMSQTTRPEVEIHITSEPIPPHEATSSRGNYARIAQPTPKKPKRELTLREANPNAPEHLLRKVEHFQVFGVWPDD